MLRRTLFIIGGSVGLLVLVALAVPLLLDVNRYKPQLEAVASDALGMEFRVGGRLGMGFFPGFQVTVEDGRLLGEHGEAVASVKRARLWIDPLRLIRKEIRLRRVELTQPRISIERDAEGRSNTRKLKKGGALLRALDGGSLSVSDGTFLYADSASGGGFRATKFDLAVSRIRLTGGKSTRPMKGVSFKAKVACAEFATKDLSLSDLRLSVDGKNGVLEFKPVSMRLFGGQAEGTLRADVSGPVPHYQVRFSVPGIRIEEFLKTLSSERVLEGQMNLSVRLSMRGKTRSEMTQTADGEASLRGQDIVLLGKDIDKQLSRFESSQGFNLVDIGAVFYAGPLGLAVTKGYNFASLFKGSGDSSRVRTLVSDWRVERGVAQAKDVAMATSENRLALQGGLDFANGRFADVTVAVINEEGCAKARQVIRGPFEKPEVEKPHILKSLTGPIRKLVKQARRLLPAGPCEVFYSGSVAHPK